MPSTAQSVNDRSGGATTARTVSAVQRSSRWRPRRRHAHSFSTHPGNSTSASSTLPAIGDDDALLHVEACGLCGTDHEQFTGELFPGFAFVPGHESVGIIERIGNRAAARWGVREGDRVAVEVFLSCGTCAACRGRDLPPLRTARARRHVRMHPGRARARIVGRLRAIPISRARLAAAARSRDAGPGARNLVQSRRRGDQVGGDTAGTATWCDRRRARARGTRPRRKRSREAGRRGIRHDHRSRRT